MPSKENNFTYIRVNPETGKIFDEFLSKYDVSASEYFTSVNFYLNKVLEQFELEFIKYYFKREKLAKQGRKPKNEPRKKVEGFFPSEVKDRYRICFHKDIANNTLQRLEENFSRRFKQSRALEFFVLKSLEIAPLIELKPKG